MSATSAVAQPQEVAPVPEAAPPAAPAPAPASVPSTGQPAAQPASAWRTAAIGAGALVAILALLALAMVLHGARRNEGRRNERSGR